MISSSTLFSLSSHIISSPIISSTLLSSHIIYSPLISYHIISSHLISPPIISSPLLSSTLLSSSQIPCPSPPLHPILILIISPLSFLFNVYCTIVICPLSTHLFITLTPSLFSMLYSLLYCVWINMTSIYNRLYLMSIVLS